MASEPHLLSIGEVAAASGLRPSALRFYEEEGLIRAAARLGGRRHYDPSVLRRLAIIALCQEVGFTVAEISRLLGEGKRARRRWRALAERKLEELDAHIDRAKQTRTLLETVLACGCRDPATCERVTGVQRRRSISSRIPTSGAATVVGGPGSPILHFPGENDTDIARTVW